MKVKQLTFTCLFGVIMFFGAACGGCSAGNDERVSFSDEIIKASFSKVNDLIASTDEVYVDKVLYGSFTNINNDEFLALIKFKNNVHVGGLDKTIAFVFDNRTSDVVCYKEFLADKVTIMMIPQENNVDLILYLGETTYQGMSTRVLQMYDVTGEEWDGLYFDNLELYTDKQCYVCCDGTLIVESDITSETIAVKEYLIAKWDEEQGEYLINK